MAFFGFIYVLCWMSLATTIAAIEPAAVYDGGFNSTNSTTLLRIGNGGAGQSGLVKGTFLAQHLLVGPKVKS